MDRCKVCGSYAINPHLHGRKASEDLDLCDVCYWRKRVDGLVEALEEFRELWERVHPGVMLDKATVVMAKQTLAQARKHLGE